MPQEPSRFPAPPPRVRGENARLTQQKQTIKGELGAALAQPGERSDPPAEEAYAAEVRPLSWSNPAIASALGATAMREGVSAPARRSAPTQERGPRAAIVPCRRPAGNSRLQKQRGGGTPN